MATDTHQSRAIGAHCPHCQLVVDAEAALPWPPAGIRCPHCQLLIGPGRARSKPSGSPGAKGTAAGVFSRQARRDGQDRADGAAHSPDQLLDAIRAVAATVGHRPERLLMVDYQQRAMVDPELPALSELFSAFGSWKAARREAAEPPQSLRR